jgi:hypothetical protein
MMVLHTMLVTTLHAASSGNKAWFFASYPSESSPPAHGPGLAAMKAIVAQM